MQPRCTKAISETLAPIIKDHLRRIRLQAAVSESTIQLLQNWKKLEKLVIIWTISNALFPFIETLDDEMRKIELECFLASEVEMVDLVFLKQALLEKDDISFENKYNTLRSNYRWSFTTFAALVDNLCAHIWVKVPFMKNLNYGEISACSYKDIILLLMKTLEEIIKSGTSWIQTLEQVLELHLNDSSVFLKRDLKRLIPDLFPELNSAYEV